MESLPRLRAGLLRHELDGQVLVYDTRHDRIHLLDPTTGCVLELLQEGGWTAEGVIAEIAERLKVPADSGLVSLALDELRAADLLDQAASVPAPLVDVNRRAVLRRLAMTGAAAALIPAIATFTATAGYAQGSLLGVGGLCGTNNGLCASGRCCGGACRTAACSGNNGSCGPGVNPGPNTTVPDCTCCSGFCNQQGGGAGSQSCTKP